jgi:hypothetical protein
MATPPTESRLLPRQSRTSRILLFIFCGVLSSCASAPQKSLVTTSKNGDREGVWHGKLLLTDKKTNKSHTVVIDASARESANHSAVQMRLEVETQLGIYLASIVLNDKQLSFLLPRQKRFVQAPATADSMARFVSVPLDPKIFVELLFDETPESTDLQDLHLTWDQRTAERRVLHLVSSRVDARLSLENMPTKVEFRGGLFDLQPPKGYKVEKISE